MKTRGAIRSILISLVLSLFFPSPAVFPETRSLSAEYLSTEISTRNGLPQNTVYSIACDREGYIWIGTDRGVSRFDGAHFNHFNMYNTPSIRNNSVTALLVNPDGSLLLGTYGGGLVVCRDGEFKEISPEGVGRRERIWQLVRDRDNNLWAITSGAGLIRLDRGGTARTFSPENRSGRLTSITSTPSGDILAASEQDVFKIRDNTLSRYSIQGKIRISGIISIRAHSSKELYICTNHGLFKCEMGSGRIEIKGKFFQNTAIRDTFRDSGGIIWVITEKGLKKLDGNREIHYISEYPFFSGSLLTILEGPEKNLWIGSSGLGLRVLRKRHFFRHKLTPDQSNGHVHSVCEYIGYLAAGTRDRGLIISGQGKYKRLTIDNGLPSNTVNSVLFHNGKIIAGTLQGISLISNAEPGGQKPEFVNLLPGVEILSLYEISENTVFIGTRRHGLYEFKNDKVSDIGGGSGTASLSIYAILKNHNNSILLGTDRGVKIFHPAPAALSSLPGSETIEGPVYELFKDMKQRLWIGSKDRGLLILADSRLIPAVSSGSLHPAPVFRILEDEKKNIWMSTDNGIFMLRSNDVSRYLRSISDTLNPVFYSQEDGITIPVFSGGSQPAGMMSRSGSIYFPSREGIIRFDPDQFPVNSRPPVVHIRGLRTGKGKFTPGSPISLKHNTGTIRVTYSIISFTRRDKIVAKIELTGRGRKWPSRTLTGDEVTFRDLPPGKYRLNIKASNNEGIWNLKGASLVFRIASPFHKTLPFYLLLIGVLYIVSPFLYRAFINLRKKRDERAKEKYKYSKLTAVDSHIYIKKLKDLMENDKLYLDPNLKIRDLSSRTGIPAKKISQLINDVLDENFKSFVNRYRIEEAKILLADPDNKNFVLLKIIYEAGFNSKSVFNTAFKKHTGMTPSEFRKKTLSS